MNNYNPYQPRRPGVYNQPQLNNYQPTLNYYSYVNGIEGARAFQIQPGTSILLMDTDNPVFYHKTANDIGQATIKIYKFEEVTEQPKQEIVPYITKDEVEEMIRNAFQSQKNVKKSTAGE